MIDHNGNLLNQITYNSKGEIVNQTSPTVSFRFAYTGREFDISTGLYYNRARYYDPITGRFISQDPIGFDSGDVNLYRYVNNSPTNFTDRSGLFFDGLLASLITTVVITVLRGVITGNWEFSFGATFTDDGDVSLNFGSGPFNTGPIPLRTTSDFSNITLRSAAELGSTINVNPIEFDTTFVPTTFDTRNLDFSNLRFTPQTSFFNSTQQAFAWDAASLAQPNISRNLIAQLTSDSAIPLYDEEQQQDFSWLTNAYKQYQSNQNNQNFTVGALGAVTLGTGASLGATNRVSTILSNAGKLGANLASAKATILAGLTGAIYFALPQKRVGDLTLAGRMRMLSIEDAQKYFLSNSDVQRQNILDSLSQEEIHRFGLDSLVLASTSGNNPDDNRHSSLDRQGNSNLGSPGNNPRPPADPNPFQIPNNLNLDPGGDLANQSSNNPPISGIFEGDPSLTPTPDAIRGVRERYGIQPNVDTIAVGRTDIDIPGFEHQQFKGFSETLRRDLTARGINLPPNIGDIKSPFGKDTPQAVGHAEEHLLNQIDAKIKSLGLSQPELDRALSGKTLSIRVSHRIGACSWCISGLAKRPNPKAADGVIMQFSKKYPTLTIRIESESRQSPFVVRNRKRIR